jgi:putative hemolysin
MLSLPIELLILALLVFANGLLAMAETAVVSSKKTRLRKLVLRGDKEASQALSLAEQPTRFLALVQFWLTLSGTIAGVLGGAGLAEQIQTILVEHKMGASLAWILAYSAVTVGLSALMILFGELVPKRVGLAYPEQVAMALAGLMNALAWLAAPFLQILDFATNTITKVLRVKPRPISEAIGDDEVRALVEQGLHAGVFHRAEKEMVEGVLALDQLLVTSIMTPRPKIVFLNIEDPEETNWRKIVTSGHSYFPVYQSNRDQIAGMVAVKALWAHSAIGLPTQLKNLLISPLFVSETTTAMQMLERFKKTGRHVAVVVDEFGIVQGLVTLIDVFEAIVGDLPEPGRSNQPTTKPQEDGTWIIDATHSISDIKAILGLDGITFPQEIEAQYRTLGGYVLTHFGRIPEVGDSFESLGFKFVITEMDRRRVDKVHVIRLNKIIESKEN